MPKHPFSLLLRQPCWPRQPICEASRSLFRLQPLDVSPHLGPVRYLVLSRQGKHAWVYFCMNHHSSFRQFFCKLGFKWPYIAIRGQFIIPEAEFVHPRNSQQRLATYTSCISQLPTRLHFRYSEFYQSLFGQYCPFIDDRIAKVFFSAQEDTTLTNRDTPKRTASDADSSIQLRTNCEPVISIVRMVKRQA